MGLGINFLYSCQIFVVFVNKRKMATQRTPPQNGIDERRNRSIMDCARTLMMENNVSQKYWRGFVSIVVYTLNQV